MPIFDIFKKKKKPASKPPKLKEEKKEERPLKEEKIKPEASRVRKKVSGNASQVLRFPHVTEKATDLNENNKYVFKVWPRANKTEIKEAVEDVYGVEVKKVNVINIPRKQRRLGKQKGWRKGYKKAIVQIKKGQKIEILPR